MILKSMLVARLLFSRIFSQLSCRTIQYIFYITLCVCGLVLSLKARRVDTNNLVIDIRNTFYISSILLFSIYSRFVFSVIRFSSWFEGYYFKLQCWTDVISPSVFSHFHAGSLFSNILKTEI